MSPTSTASLAKVQSYLAKRFGSDQVELRKRKVEDSVEVWLNGEILGLLYIDDEDPNDVSYDLNVSILADDLD